MKKRQLIKRLKRRSRGKVLLVSALSFAAIIGFTYLIISSPQTFDTVISTADLESDALYARETEVFEVEFGSKAETDKQVVTFSSIFEINENLSLQPSEQVKSNLQDRSFQEKTQEWIKKVLKREDKAKIQFSLTETGIEDTRGDLSDALQRKFEDRVEESNTEELQLEVEQLLLSDADITTKTEVVTNEDTSAGSVTKEYVFNPEVVDRTDIKYQVIEGKGLKEEIVIKKTEGMSSDCLARALSQSVDKIAETCNLPKNQYIFEFNLDPGIEVHRTLTGTNDKPSGVWYFTDKYGRYLAHIEPLFAIDSAESRTNSVNLDIDVEQGTMTVTLDLDWLLDSKRVYPVTIDPSIVHDTESEFDAGAALNRIESISGPKVQTPYHELPSDEHTVGLWHMNNDWTDSSGNGNTGTAYGDATFTTSSKLGSHAGTFDGTGDYVISSSGPSFDEQSIVTISVWFKPTDLDTGGSSVCFISLPEVSISANGIDICQDNNEIKFTFVTHSDFSSNIITTTLTDTNWHNITLIYNGAILYGYLDGILIGSDPVTVGAGIKHASGEVNIGRWGAGSGLYWDGQIDEVAIYNRALTPEEIKANAQRRPYGVYTSDVLDLGSDVTAIDSLQWTENGVQTGDGETPLDASNLVAAWYLNENSGTTASNGAGAGSCGGTPANCDGTLTGFSNTTGQDVVAGSGWTAQNGRWPRSTPEALMFDGSNDYVSVSDNDSLSFGNAISDDPFSVESWVYMHDITNFNIVEKMVSSSDGEYRIQPDYMILCDANRSNIIYASVADISSYQNQWAHCVATYDGSGTKEGIMLYINGVDATSSRAAGGSYTAMHNTVGDLMIGKRIYATTDYANGSIDSPRIYSRALGADEILSNYQAGNIEFQTRTGADTSPDDGSWEAWAPVTSESQLENMDNDEANWEWDATAKVLSDGVFKADGVSQTAITHLGDDKFVVAYVEDGTSTKGYVRVGEFTGSGITWGSELEFGSLVSKWQESIDIDTLSSGQVILVYRDYNDGNDNEVVLFNISGLTITQQDAEYINLRMECGSAHVVALDTSTFVVIYDDDDSHNRNQAEVGTVSGNTITFSHTESDITTSTIACQNIAALDSSTIVVCYDSWGGATYCKVGNVSGDTVTFGSAYQINSTQSYYMSVTSLASNKFVAAYTDGGDNKGKNVVGDISGTVISYGSEYQFYNGTPSSISIAKLDSDEFILAFDDKNIHGSVSGNVITSDDEYVDFNHGNNAGNIYVDTFDSNEFVISYRDSSNSDYGKIAIDRVTPGLWPLRKEDKDFPDIEGTGSMKVQQGAPQVDRHTVALWHLDETNGDLAGVDVFDETVNNNDGELNGTAPGPEPVNGIFGKARDFNGSDDYVKIPGSAVNRDVGTVEMWVYPHFASNDNNAHYFFDSDTARHALYKEASNHVQIYDDGRYTNFGNTSWNANEWHQIVFVYNKTGNVQKLYFDGAEQSSTGSGGTWGSNDVGTNAYIGMRFSEIEPFDGIIDELRISDVVRTPEEIAEAYRMGRDHRLSRTISSADLSGKTKLPFYIAADKAGTYLESTIGESTYVNYLPDANTVGFWHLEEDSGYCDSGESGCVKDSSSSGNNGTPSSAPHTVQGKIGKGWEFDGTDDYIQISNSTDWDLTGDFALEGWFKSDVTGAHVPMSTTPNSAATAGWAVYPNITTSGYIGFLATSGGGTWNLASITPTVTMTTNTWYHYTITRSGSTLKIYLNGNEIYSGTNTSAFNTSNSLYISGFSNQTNMFNGILDEVRIINGTARTAEEIRQAYEIGRRTHPITIDFSAKLDSGNLIANSSDLSFTVDATAYGFDSKGDNLFVGDKIIVKENYGGTEYIAQGDVTAVNTSTGAVTVDAWDTGATFPASGYTVNTTVFKWQREYWDVTGPLSSHINAATNLTLRVTDGSEGRTFWLDDFKSGGTYLTDGTATGNVSSTVQQYMQYRAIFTTHSTWVTPWLSDVTVNYTAGPAAPTMDLVMRHGKYFDSGEKQPFWWAK